MRFENYKKLQKAKEKFLKLTKGIKFDLAIILGSVPEDEISKIVNIYKTIDFSEIPFLKKSSVVGHQSKIHFGCFKNKNILIQSGRLHLYEGYSPFEVCLTVALYGEAEIKKIIITNAAGGIKSDFETGDIMLISDHINFQGENVLIDFPDDGNKFLDMSSPYSQEYYPLLKEKYDIKKGVYLGVKGPSYETPSEIKAFEKLGADAVGMSTVQEVILANYYGMKVTGLSLITNKASGLKQSLSHKEVLEAGKMVKDKFYNIIKEMIYLT